MKRSKQGGNPPVSRKKTEEIKTLLLEGGHPQKIAKSKMVSVTTIRRIAKRENIPISIKEEPWSEKDIKTLKDLSGSGGDLSTIAVALKRKKRVVRSKAKALGIVTSPMPCKQWEAPEIKQLKDLASQGRTTQQIAEVLGRSHVSIWKKARELGVKIRNGNTLSEERKGLLWDLLEAGKSYKEISREIGVGKTRASRWAKEWGFVKTHEQQVITQRENIKLKKKGKRRCCRCGQIKNLEDFRNGKGRCKDCREATRKLRWVLSMRVGGAKQRSARWRKQGEPRGNDFNIDIAFLELLFTEQEGVCYYTGEKLEWRREKSDWALSLDRINPLVGYRKDNVVLCVWWANWAKGEQTEEDFRKWCEKVVHHNKSEQQLMAQEDGAARTNLA